MKQYFLALAAAAAFLMAGCGERTSFPGLMDKAGKAASDGRWADALQFTGRAVKLEPANLSALILNALALENNGKNEQAAEEISKAAAIAPNDFFAQYTKGRILFENKRYDSCIDPLLRAASLRKSDSNSKLLLAQAYMNLGNMPGAARYYSLLASDPMFKSSPAVWTSLGIIWLTEYRKPSQALSYFNYAYKLDPQNPSCVLNLGIIQDKSMRNPREAVRFYRYYLSLIADDTTLEARRASVNARIKALSGR